MERDDGWQLMHEAMLERQYRLEEALARAEAGQAIESDWATIRFECGLPAKPRSE